ncbi:hypothetical protein CCHL11_00207 [Colletotrichum chlorophyti]|uniref:Uncharacterized protein n=1 Tax=Colletotrichum chlorophyti TaxID=708187 RepID=A0A1Q8RVT3_9PEZI|nr:hypothetical protein CCHL11_00207 [Colletotrichum chlorophyti]
MTTTEPTNNPLTTQRGAAPLTTVFTTPDFCSSLYWTNTITPPLSSIVCMPTSWHQVYDYSWGFYSPAICPLGYSEGCAFPTSLATSSDGAIGMGGPVIAGETPRICCPTGYTCYSDIASKGYSKCLSTVPTRSFYDIENQPTSQLALVFAVQVRWQASDLSILETDPTDPGATYTGPRSTASGVTASASGTTGGTGRQTAGATVPTATSTTTPQGSDSDTSSGGGGFSVGTTIGIAVGSVVGTLAIAMIAFMLCWRRRRRRERSSSDVGPDSLSPPILAHKVASGKDSLDIVSPNSARPTTGTTAVGGVPSSPATTQLDSTTLMEMEVMERPQELSEDNAIIELEGDMPGPPLYREKEGWPLRS